MVWLDKINNTVLRLQNHTHYIPFTRRKRWKNYWLCENDGIGMILLEWLERFCQTVLGIFVDTTFISLITKMCRERSLPAFDRPLIALFFSKCYGGTYFGRHGAPNHRGLGLFHSRVCQFPAGEILEMPCMNRVNENGWHCG